MLSSPIPQKNLKSPHPRPYLATINSGYLFMLVGNRIRSRLATHHSCSPNTTSLVIYVLTFWCVMRHIPHVVDFRTLISPQPIPFYFASIGPLATSMYLIRLSFFLQVLRLFTLKFPFCVWVTPQWVLTFAFMHAHSPILRGINVLANLNTSLKCGPSIDTYSSLVSNISAYSIIYLISFHTSLLNQRLSQCCYHPLVMTTFYL